MLATHHLLGDTMRIFWILVTAVAFVGLVLLIIRMLRHKANITKIANKNGWDAQKKLGRTIPEEIHGETLNSLGDPENDWTFSCDLMIRGRHRKRPFTLITRGQKPTRHGEWGQSSYIFTRLSDIGALPPLMILPSSVILKPFNAKDERQSEIVGRPVFETQTMSPEFDQSYTVRGLAGAKEFVTPTMQKQILAKPDMFQRDAEPWYERYIIPLCLSENFAFIEVPSITPNTLINRLDMLMDWAEIVEGHLAAK